jgi:hypothetical protein
VGTAETVRDMTLNVNVHVEATLRGLDHAEATQVIHDRLRDALAGYDDVVAADVKVYGAGSVSSEREA